MSLANTLRTLLAKRALDKRLHLRKLIRQARSAAAQRGHSTQWKRRGQTARDVLGSGV